MFLTGYFLILSQTVERRIPFFENIPSSLPTVAYTDMTENLPFFHLCIPWDLNCLQRGIQNNLFNEDF